MQISCKSGLLFPLLVMAGWIGCYLLYCNTVQLTGLDCWTWIDIKPGMSPVFFYSRQTGGGGLGLGGAAMTSR